MSNARNNKKARDYETNSNSDRERRWTNILTRHWRKLEPTDDSKCAQPNYNYARDAIRGMHGGIILSS
jgi:hypothetical protein